MNVDHVRLDIWVMVHMDAEDIHDSVRQEMEVKYVTRTPDVLDVLVCSTPSVRYVLRLLGFELLDWPLSSFFSHCNEKTIKWERKKSKELFTLYYNSDVRYNM